MSIARSEFLRNLAGLNEAIALESLAQGGSNATVTPAVFVLRRGILVASLISLETFIRDRTSESLQTLERWPRSFEDFPEKLRSAARLNALSNLSNFAKMLKRQDEDYENELRVEILKMASGHGGALQFSKFVAGDYTDNVSDSTIKDILSSLQVKDCWATFRTFSSDVGIGVPSVQEIVKGIVRKRHRSAHSANYSPTPTDIVGLTTDLLCVAMCFDVAVSASMEQAIAQTAKWKDGNCNWRDGVHLYIATPSPRGIRLSRFGQSRALRVVADIADARVAVPRAEPGSVAVLVEHESSGRPNRWDIL